MAARGLVSIVERCAESSALTRERAVAVDPAVGGGALGGGPADGADRVLELPGLLADPPLRARHPADGLLHERPAEVVRAAPEQLPARLDPHLHPRHLDVRDTAVQ